VIEFLEVSKSYPGSAEPVVRELSFTVPEGEICVLVGPSGCGKTTTMRMVNRLIEPTSGEIRIDGEPNTTMSPTALRRKIGYAIQEIGLFPHRTIRENVSTVPKLLEWSRGEIDDRASELLSLVGLDPEQYGDRYPAELSGGQQQRVGVARAMAADPPVMLMDEPFGAVDPITRERLQDEFLKIQQEINKTIVFVTHDIDEAIKMGDHIAILEEGGVLAQYDTPERILTEPATDFVASFVGGDRVLKRLSLTRVSDFPLEPLNGEAPDDSLPRIGMEMTLRQALSELIGSGSERGVVAADGAGEPSGAISLDGIREFSRTRTAEAGAGPGDEVDEIG
jgi:osmoprotectant transport system ATP-binding protein